MKTRVLVVDDQSLVRAGFVMILEQVPHIEVIGEASTGVEAVTAAQDLRPDVILMDIRMPDMDGIEATRRILASPESTIQVIILTTFDPDEYVYDALASGASGFILKETDPEDLIKAIDTVAAGEALLSPSITRRLIERFARHRPNEQPDRAKLNRLTAREQDILRAVARGLNNDEIAELHHIAKTTVKTHVSSILTKLSLRDRTQAVVLAYEAGLIRPGQPDRADPGAPGSQPKDH